MSDILITRNAPQTFSDAAPDYVGRLRVVALVKHLPGGVGTYESATVVTEETADAFDERRFATHLLVHADDRPAGHPHRWYLTAGHYRLTLAEAAQDATTR